MNWNDGPTSLDWLKEQPTRTLNRPLKNIMASWNLTRDFDLQCRLMDVALDGKTEYTLTDAMAIEESLANNEQTLGSWLKETELRPQETEAMNLYAECYRIAELAHKGVDDDHIRDECDDVAIRHTESVITGADIYRRSEQIYAREFESR
jgi:hypothetical protein